MLFIDSLVSSPRTQIRWHLFKVLPWRYQLQTNTRQAPLLKPTPAPRTEPSYTSAVHQYFTYYLSSSQATLLRPAALALVAHLFDS